MPPLTREELQRVLERAVELHANEPTSDGDGDGDGDGAELLSPAELERIGEEVGLSPVALEQALSEARTGALAPLSPPGPVERVLGPRRQVLERLVPGSPAAILEQLERFLRSQLLCITRDHGERKVWQPSLGWTAQLRRTLNWSGELTLEHVQELEVLLLPGPTPAQTRLRFTVDTTALQTRAVAGATVGGVLGLCAAGALMALGGPHVLPWLAAAAATGTGVAGSWRIYRRDLQRTTSALEHLLDLLERGRAKVRRPGLAHLFGW